MLLKWFEMDLKIEFRNKTSLSPFWPRWPAPSLPRNLAARLAYSRSSPPARSHLPPRGPLAFLPAAKQLSLSSFALRGPTRPKPHRPSCPRCAVFPLFHTVADKWGPPVSILSVFYLASCPHRTPPPQSLPLLRIVALHCSPHHFPPHK